MELLNSSGDWKLFRKNFFEKAERFYVDGPFIQLTAEIFESCPFKDYIFQGQEVLFILSSGSSLNGLTDAQSDYDIIVITKKSYKPAVDYRLSYKNRIMHWYYHTIDELCNPPLNDFIAFWGTFEYKFLKLENIFYINTAYIWIVDTLLKSKNILSDIGRYESYIRTKSLIYNFVNLPSEDISRLPLKFYHMIIYMYLESQNLDKDFKFLLRVKRMRYTSLNTEDFEKLKNLLLECLASLPEDQLIIDKVQSLKQEYYDIWSDYLKELKII